MHTSTVDDADWPYLLTFLPANLAESARQHRAFLRSRAIDSPQTLLRLILAYAAGAGSLRTVAAWATARELACLSDVALLKRFRRAAAWLGWLVTRLLAEQTTLPAPTARPVRLRLLDATTISRPGSAGTDWRVHLSFDLQSLCVAGVELTDATGGESLTRAALAAGELWIADRGYAHRAGIVAGARAGATVIVRLNLQNVPLVQADGTPFDLLAALRSLPAATVGEFLGSTAPDPKRQLPAVAGRLIALRKSPAQAEAARRRLHREARKDGRTPMAATLEAAGYIILFTTVPATEWDAAAIAALYRFRWQIELAFKRLKGIVELDEMAAKDPDLCKTFLLGKLLLFLLTDRFRSGAAAFSPWGYGCPAA